MWYKSQKKVILMFRNCGWVCPCMYMHTCVYVLDFMCLYAHARLSCDTASLNSHLLRYYRSVQHKPRLSVEIFQDFRKQIYGRWDCDAPATRSRAWDSDSDSLLSRRGNCYLLERQQDPQQKAYIKHYDVQIWPKPGDLADFISSHCCYVTGVTHDGKLRKAELTETFGGFWKSWSVCCRWNVCKMLWGFYGKFLCSFQFFIQSGTKKDSRHWYKTNQVFTR